MKYRIIKINTGETDLYFIKQKSGLLGEWEPITTYEGYYDGIVYKTKEQIVYFDTEEDAAKYIDEMSTNPKADTTIGAEIIVKEIKK